MITPQARQFDVLIADLHGLHIRKTFDMVEKASNIQISDMSSKPHGKKNIRDLIGQAVGLRIYPPPWSEYSKLICLNSFHISNHHQAP